ncbi:MAG: hypothetical protein AB7R89_29540 [Dehalococcoidia bacterium]
MPFDIWFGQFNTVHGAVQEEGPYVGIFEGDADQPDGVGVYVMVEPCGGAGADLCASTIEAIARGFGEPGKALTASLLRAMNAAHEHVRRHHPGDAFPDFGVGITVLATRRSETYIVQAGPALACVRSGGVIKIIEPIGDAAREPVGSGGRVTPSFARIELQPGDTVLILFSQGSEVVDRRRLPQIVAQPPEHALPDLYLRSRDLVDFAALYLSVMGQHRTPPEVTASGSSRSTYTEATSWGSVAGDSATGTETLVAEKVVESERRNGHSSFATEAVRTIMPRRTPLGSMAPAALPITRRRLAIAGAVAIVCLLLLLGLPIIARQGKTEKFNQLLRGADEAITAAEREPDLVRRRELLDRAQATVDEAQTLRAVTPAELAGLEQRLSDQLAEIDGVRELSDLTQVADLAAPGLAAPSASQIALGPSIYLLDPAAGKVIALPREGEPKPVTAFEEGRSVGPNRTGKARAMTWWAAEGDRPGSLLVLDDQRRLYAIDERGDILPVALGNTEQWKSDIAIAMGTSNLYVLDPGANQIWRYTLNGGGFPGDPEEMLNQRANVKDANGLSLAAGPIVTTPDGRMLRIDDGREQAIQIQAMDRPLLAPAPPLLNSGDGLLYVADRGNQRIVRFNADGTFQGQLTHHRLAGLQAIALDEAAGVLYAIAGQTVVRASIPR